MKQFLVFFCFVFTICGLSFFLGTQINSVSKTENCNAITEGTFDFPENKITLFVDRISNNNLGLKEPTINRISFAFFHELGHYYWYNYMAESERAEYETAFLTKKNFVSEYAKKSSSEDFAEEYASRWSCKYNG